MPHTQRLTIYLDEASRIHGHFEEGHAEKGDNWVRPVAEDGSPEKGGLAEVGVNRSLVIIKAKAVTDQMKVVTGR